MTDLATNPHQRVHRARTVGELLDVLTDVDRDTPLSASIDTGDDILAARVDRVLIRDTSTSHPIVQFRARP